MRPKTINLALASNEAFFPGLLVTVGSVLLNCSTSVAFRIYILDGGLRDESWRHLQATLGRFPVSTELHRLAVDLRAFAGCKTLNQNHVAYARLLLPTLIPESRIVYLDSDLLFQKDIQELDALPLAGCLAAAAPDAGVKFLYNDCPHTDLQKTQPNGPYFNSGVFVMDLDEWRRQGVDQQVREFLNQYGADCRLYDQTALNWLLVNKVKLLDPAWNVFAGSTPASEIDCQRNIHFVLKKPWQGFVPGVNHCLWHGVAELLGCDLSKAKSGSQYQLSKLAKPLWQTGLLTLLEIPLRPLLSNEHRKFITLLRAGFENQDQIKELRARWEKRLRPLPANDRSPPRRQSAILSGLLDLIDFFPRPIQAVSYENLPHVQRHAVREFPFADTPKSIHEASEWQRWTKDLPAHLRSPCLHSCHTISLHPGYADGFGNVFSGQRQLVMGAVVPYRDLLKDHYLPRRILPRIQRFPSVGVLTHGMQGNYYHWLMEVLPRVHLLQSHDSPPAHLYLQTKRKFQQETIRLLGYAGDQIISATDRELIYAEDLTIAFHEIRAPLEHPGWVNDFLRSSYLPLVDRTRPDPPPARLYISRAASLSRQVVNEPEVLEFLQRLGFQKIIPEELSFLDQVRLFHHAEAIIAPHGAALANLVFSQPGTKVIEFQPWKLQDVFFRLSQSLGVDHYYLKSDVGPANPTNNNQSLTINLANLQKTLQLAALG